MHSTAKCRALYADIYQAFADRRFACLMFWRRGETHDLGALCELRKESLLMLGILERSRPVPRKTDSNFSAPHFSSQARQIFTSRVSFTLPAKNS
jgi:hypothetical protein